jgi:hypothetical protein
MGDASSDRSVSRRTRIQPISLQALCSKASGLSRRNPNTLVLPETPYALCPLALAANYDVLVMHL